jgi:hypothetical protein
MNALTRHRSPRSLRHHLVQAAGTTAVAATVAALLLPDGLDIAGFGLSDDSGTSHSRVQTPTSARVDALMDRYRCSTEGFGERAIPRSAIVRRADGHVALVSFDRGWEVFQQHGPASLVAVCLRGAR